MSPMPGDEDVREVLRNLKKYNAMDALAVVAGISDRTLYRHASTAPPDLGPNTRETLVELFVELDLFGEYGPKEMVAAVKELRRRAEAIREAEALADEDELDPPDDPPGENERTG